MTLRILFAKANYLFTGFCRHDFNRLAHRQIFNHFELFRQCRVCGAELKGKEMD